jgi:hypothetical protein
MKPSARLWLSEKRTRCQPDRDGLPNALWVKRSFSARSPVCAASARRSAACAAT